MRAGTVFSILVADVCVLLSVISYCPSATQGAPQRPRDLLEVFEERQKVSLTLWGISKIDQLCYFKRKDPIFNLL